MPTLDLDVVYRRTPDNIARVAESVARHHPYLRGAPPGLEAIAEERRR